MVEKKFTFNEVDQLCEEAVVKIKKSGFDPDTIVGITTGGAILGKIIALKLGRRFTPDYRKYGLSSHFLLPKDAKKILVVDDKMDLGGTLIKCLRDIILITHPELDAKTLSRTMQTPSGMDVRFFVFLDSCDAHFKPNYSLYPSLDFDFPWGKYPEPFTDKSLREELQGSNLNWANSIIELFDFLAQFPRPVLDKFYQNRPLSTDALKRFLDCAAEIDYCIVVENEIDPQNFIDICKEYGYVTLGDSKDKITPHDDPRGNIFRFQINESTKELRLTFKAEMLRTFDDMCRNCELKALENNELCQTCNSYVRSLELFENLYYVLERAYKVKSAKLVLKNAHTEVVLEHQIIEDLKKKNGIK